MLKAIGATLLAVVLSLPTAALGQALTSRDQFAVDLSRALFSREQLFVEIGAGQGWRGVVLARPGTSIAPITEAYSGIPGSLSQALANATVFDRPVQIEGGYASFGVRTLDAIWPEILADARPTTPLPRDRMLREAVMKWLFKPIFKKKKVVGYTREPSRYVLRYREFDATYSMLQRGKDSGLWQLDSRLRKYATYEQAEADVLSQWYKSGYKAEVESAQWSFEASAEGDSWHRWARANELFETHMLPFDVYTKLPETYLFPPPASWSSVSSWLRATSVTDGGEYRFQLARVRVERPWMDLDALLSAKITLTPGAAIVSTGTIPTPFGLPSGRMSAIVEELVLVRDVKLVSGRPDTDHPLAAFAYPDTINLVGYVVKVLPTLPAAIAPETTTTE